MTEKDLKKLKRYQLLELLIAQTERADKLQERLELVEQKLAEREIEMSTLGSIAEASLHITGVFQSAQEAADQYLKAAKEHADRIEEAAYKKAAEILSQAQEQAIRLNEE